MTTDQKRQISEHLLKAKNELLEAMRLAESAGTPFATPIGTLCGRVESLQGKFSRTTAKG